MLSSHPQRRQPVPGGRYLAAIDIGGQDESATGEFGQLDNPQRDYTVCTIARVDTSAEGGSLGPVYQVQDVFVDHGSRHFQSRPGQPALLDRLLAYLRHWVVAAVIVDATGVGQGLADALSQSLPPETVIPFNFATSHNKARLGNDFLALIETARFKYFHNQARGSKPAVDAGGDEGGPPGSDAWWFFTQCRACGYELAEGLPLEKGLKWGVSPTATANLLGRPQLIHDDRLLSAALIAEADRLYRAGQLLLGSGVSAVIRREF